MRMWRVIVLGGTLCGLAAPTGRAQAPPPTSAAAFHGIGDLAGPGGVGSAVRDATRVDGVLYAVGSSTVNATATLPQVPQLDTPVLWTRSGSGTTLEGLPNLAEFTSTQTDYITAYGITRDGAYIASQARPANAVGTRWVRVTRSLLPAVAANNDVNANTGGPVGFAALAISDGDATSPSGAVLYGQHQSFPGGVDTRVAVRYEDGVGFSFVPLPAGKTWSVPVPRGTSRNGRMMVGAASVGPITGPALPNGTFGTNTVAFRYEHTANTLTGTTSVIPLLDGGTWNLPVALSGNGEQTVVVGNSPEYPNGEVYLTNSANQITARLGSPNPAWGPRVLGGMTDDGAVVAVTFSGQLAFGPGQIAGLGIPPGGKYAYIHNSHGWFHFSSVLAAEGIDLVAMGWNPTNLAITGIRTVDGVDLVFGQGRRWTIGTLPNGTTGYVDGAVEGFVAELPAGVLADFHPQPAAPTDQSLVGAWIAGDPAVSTTALAFLADGTFYRMSAQGFERGLYTWAGNNAGGGFNAAHAAGYRRRSRWIEPKRPIGPLVHRERGHGHLQ